MRSICFALFLALAGCAHHPKVVASPYQVQQFTQEDIQKVADYALEALGGDLTGWQVILIDTYIVVKNPETPSEVVFADGITLPAKQQIIVFAYSTCLADSSLIHEIGHAVGYDHGELLLKLLQKVEEMAIKELCPAGYVQAPKPDPTLMDEIVKGL